MSTAKVISMRARASQVSHLCFETGGILGTLNVQLGDQVASVPGAKAAPFLFTSFYGGLGGISATDPSLLNYDSQTILNDPKVTASLLAALRAEPRKAALDRAIKARSNAWWGKYAHQSDIISRMTTYYSQDPAATTSKPGRLTSLSHLADTIAEELAAAYASDTPPRTGVVKTTTSVLHSKTWSKDTTSDTGLSNDETFTAPARDGTWGPLPPGGAHLPVTVFGNTVSQQVDQGSTSDSSTSNDFSAEVQKIVNTDYGFRVPSLESAAQNHRAQISLMDQQFAQFMSTLNLNNLVEVFTNEINSIDLGVYQLQIALLNTLLLSPISGTVTGIYKYPGDAVQAGETVIRLENNNELILVGTVVYPGLISVGSVLSVQTNLFDSPSRISVTGTVIAARGLPTGDDRWEVHIACFNFDSSGNLIFPLGYNFDYDNTMVVI